MQAATTSGTRTSLSTTGGQRPQASLAALLRMEHMKLRARPMTKILLAIATLGTVLFMSLAYVAVRASSYDSDAARQADIRELLMPNALNDGMQIISLLAGILITVLAASIAGSEFGWGTIRTLVGTGQSRTNIVLAKIIAVVQYSIAFTLAGVAAIIVTSYGVALIGGHDISSDWMTMTFVNDFAQAFGRLTFLVFLSGAMAFSIALLTRSLAAGIAIGIGWGVVESIVVALLGTINTTGDKIAQALTTPNVNAIMDRIRFTASDANEVGASGGVNELQAFGVLTLYIVVPLVIATIVFRRRDITSGA